MRPLSTVAGSCRLCEWSTEPRATEIPSDTTADALADLVRCSLTGDVMDIGDDCDQYEPRRAAAG